MKSLILALLLSSSAYSTVDELNLDDLQGLLPSQWFDRTGFQIEGQRELNSSLLLEGPMVPLLPLYQSGSFGKKTYVGGVIDTKYIKTPSDLQYVLGMVEKIRTPEGLSLNTYAYEGKIYAIRQDYAVNQYNSKTIGLSLSFGAGKQFVLGNSEVWGLKLDFGTPLRAQAEKGANITAPLQKILEEWSAFQDADQTQFIIDQAVNISPTLLSHYTEKSLELTDSSELPLPKLSGEKNKELSTQTPQPLELTRSDSFTSGWLKIKKDLLKNISQEVKWKKDTEQQVSSEKILVNQEANAFIQTICDRLSSMYEVPKDIWPRCRVSATLVPNAWAYPGGNIFISVGLLGILSEIDSVALVLGHEIGHVMARHTTRQFSARKNVTYAASLVSTAVNLGLTAFSIGGGWGTLGSVNFLSWYPQVMLSSIGGGYLAQEGLEIAFLAPMAGLMMFSRDHEREADRLGQEAAYASGAAIESMNKGWEDFINFFESNFPRTLKLSEKIMREHPTPESRLKNFLERENLLIPLHQWAHVKNLFTEEMKSQYQKIQRRFRPYSGAYAKALRAQYHLQHKVPPKTRHFLHTMLGPSGLCLRHALGAQ